MKHTLSYLTIKCSFKLIAVVFKDKGLFEFLSFGRYNFYPSVIWAQ